MTESRERGRLWSRQNQADIFTFICAICFVFLIYALEHPPSGGAALGIILPLVVVVILHLSLGLQALSNAISTGRFYRNLWIYLYFLLVVLITLGYMGIFRAIETQLRASYERYQHPKEVVLFAAVEEHDLTGLQAALNSGADPEHCFTHQAGYRDLTPIQLSVRQDDQQALALLLEAGARPDLTCLQEGPGTPKPALHAAAHQGHPELVNLLLRHGADPDHPHSGVPLGETIAAAESLPSPSGNRGERSAEREAQVREIVALLLDAGADVKAVHHGYSVLLWAIVYGDVELVTLLIDAGASGSMPGRDGEGPLQLAAKYGHNHVLALLLERTRQDMAGVDAFVALRYAGRRKDREALDLLLQYGLNVAGFYDPAYQAEARRRMYRSIDLDDALADAIEQENDMLLDALLSAGADLNRVDDDGMMLVGRFATDPAQLGRLLDRGAEVNARRPGAGTVLHMLAGCGQCRDPVTAVKNLVAVGADINATDEQGRTPRYIARWTRQRDVETYLESVGGLLRLEEDVR